MFELNLPTINSQEITFSDTDDKIYLKNTSKTLIEIWSGGNDNPEAPVKLDQSTK